MKNSGWLPFALRWEDNDPVVDWCFLGERPLTEPFFDQDVQKALSGSDRTNRYRRTRLDALEDFPTTEPGTDPSGFIFHMSRCGSTLVSRMLGAVSTNIVIVEPAILESVLSAARSQRLSLDRAGQLLRKIVAAFGQRRIGSTANLIIKFNSRHIRDFPVITQAFPGTRSVFLYRDPGQVMSSLLRGSPDSVPPGLIESGLAGDDLSDDERVFLRNHPEQFWAKVLSLLCRAALDYSENGDSLFVNYNQLPAAVWTEISPFFKLSLTPSDIDCMQQIAVFHSKKPSVVFTGDQNAPHSQEVAAAVQQVMPLYEQLEFNRMDSLSAKE